jgi:hypothetical protein
MALALQSARAQGIGTTPTIVYTAPTTTGIQITLNEILLCNATTNTINVTVEYWTGTVATKLLYLVPIPPGASLPFQTKTNLLAGHSIRCTSSVAASLDVAISPAELT